MTDMRVADFFSEANEILVLGGMEVKIKYKVLLGGLSEKQKQIITLWHAKWYCSYKQNAKKKYLKRLCPWGRWERRASENDVRKKAVKSKCFPDRKSTEKK